MSLPPAAPGTTVLVTGASSGIGAAIARRLARTAILARSGEAAATGAGPDVLWQQPDEVARAAVAGMVAGRRVVVPGAANKLAAAGARHAPRTVLLPLAGRFGGDRLAALLASDDER